MNSVMKLAQQIRKGLDAHLGDLRKTVLGKLSLTVAALLEERKPGLAEIAARLPLKTTRSDMREQWPAILNLAKSFKFSPLASSENPL